MGELGWRERGVATEGPRGGRLTLGLLSSLSI